MKIGFICDLHLPEDENVLQYDVLEWAISDLKQNADLIIFAGDVTCNGDIDVYNTFIKKMNGLSLPFLFIPGNSDLRNKESREEISKTASRFENEFAGIKIFALNDCDVKISDSQFEILEKADEKSIVFMHHPISIFQKNTREKFELWRKNHSETHLFYAHRHESKIIGNDISLQALDPDKTIGECPCVTYFDTTTKKICKSFYSAPIPKDFCEYFGISCYDPIKHVEFCIKNNLKNLELRPNSIEADQKELYDIIKSWRQKGGENLCIHLPDVCYNQGEVTQKSIDRYIELANLLMVDRITQHVPKVSVNEAESDPTVLESICEFSAEKLNGISHPVVIGVENMHMTEKEKPDTNRRFGYTPEECLKFMDLLSKYTEHRVGINFDIGHARNNAPFSQKYQISTWFAKLGSHIVGYHIHQVTLTEGKFNNHMPITHIYGKLISFASLFKCWDKGFINKAPLIFEMRPKDAYETTLRTFEEYK